MLYYLTILLFLIYCDQINANLVSIREYFASFISWKCHNTKIAFNVGFVLFMQNIFKYHKYNWVSLAQAVPKKLLFPLKYDQPSTFTVNQKTISLQIVSNQKVSTSWENRSCINFHQIFLSDLSLLQPCKHGNDGEFGHWYWGPVLVYWVTQPD